jgi:periplasmic divalent cation tolerance protein
MDEAILITTTFEDLDEANRLASLLLEKRLVACARISGAGKSLYWWQGKVAETSEYQLTLKTARRLFPEVERLIKVEHSYQTPEIVATAIVAGSSDYLEWMARELRP